MSSRSLPRGRWTPWLLVMLARPALCGVQRMPTGPRAENGDGAGFNVVLLTLDTTRADHLGCYGFARARTPNIDGLAASGVLFRSALTPYPMTLPGHASILTGLYPYHHGVRSNGSYVLGPERLTLAEMLAAHGYATGAFVSAAVLDRRFGLDQGFEVYDDALTVRQGPLAIRERPAEWTNDAALAWLEAHAKERFFLWIHYFDVHAPYLPLEPYRTAFADAPYDGEIAALDAEIGRVLAKLDALELRARTLVVLTADHGEGLGDHGEKTHSLFLYDATLHVPLILSAPGLLGEATEITATVSSVDIVPTVLDLLGIRVDVELDGIDALGGVQEERSIYFETVSPLVDHGWAPLFGVRVRGDKLVQAPRPELFDLARDPGELVNLHAAQPERAARLADELRTHLGDDPFGRDALGSARALDAETLEGLAALGYAGLADPGSVDFDAATKLDPKDMVPYWDAVQAAGHRIAAGEPRQAIEELLPLVERFPDQPLALLSLAQAYEVTGDLAASARTLRRVVASHEGQAGSLLELARVLIASGDFAEAHEVLDAAAELVPGSSFLLAVRASLAAAAGKEEEAERGFLDAIARATGPIAAEAHAELGRMYLDRLESARAEREFAAALELDPSSALALSGLGGLRSDQGRLNEAERLFVQALRFAPSHPDVLAHLGTLRDRQGRPEEAREAVARALEIQPDSALAHHTLGLIEQSAGDPEAAAREFRAVLERKPSLLAARMNLAACLLALGDEAGAGREYEQVLERSPRVAVAASNLAIYRLRTGREADAEALFLQAIEADPDYRTPRVQLGLLCMRQGRLEDGLGHLEKALELDPAAPDHDALVLEILAARRALAARGDR